MSVPIALFTYNRPWHTRQTVQALLKNDLASSSDLIVFSDGPKTNRDQEGVTEVRGFVRSIAGFRSVAIIESATNLGLGRSIIAGVTRVLRDQDRIIVLEDDLVTSPFFLRYMNEALQLYEDEERVISVHGYVYPVGRELPSTFFLRSADCLGWGTWKRGWALFQENGKALLDELKKRHLTREFDFDGSYRYTRMLKDQIAGRNTSWAVRWYASAFLADRVTLYPGRSLIRHIGNDGTGTNFGTSDVLDVELAATPVEVAPIEAKESAQSRRIVAKYLRSVKTPLPQAIYNRLRKKVLRVLRG